MVLWLFDIAAANQLLAQSKLSIRVANQDDLAQIITIEQHTSANPWSHKQLADCVDKTYVLIHDTKLIGFSVIALIEDQAELHSIAINPDSQGQGWVAFFRCLSNSFTSKNCTIFSRSKSE